MCNCEIIDIKFILEALRGKIELVDDCGELCTSKAGYVRGFMSALVNPNWGTPFLDNQEDSEVRKILSNEHRGLTKSVASEIYSNYDDTELKCLLREMTQINVELLISKFETKKVFMTRENYVESILTLIKTIVDQSMNGNKNINLFSPLYFDSNGCYSVSTIDNSNNLNNQDYIEDLLSKKKNYVNSFDIDDSLPHNIALKEIKEELDNNCKFSNSINFESFIKKQNEFYAETCWLNHTSRDTLSQSADKQFDRLEDDIYNGIYTTYSYPYKCGLDRLKAVLDQSVLINLNFSSYKMLEPLVNSSVKLGFNHKFVDDGRIKSWVNNDEE